MSDGAQRLEYRSLKILIILVSPMNEHTKDSCEPAPEAKLDPIEPSAEEKLTAELKETHDRLLRVAAEFENFKKISQREHTNGLKFANESLILSLLPVMDNLEQAVRAGKTADSSKDLLIGVEMVLKQLCDTLQKYGVEFFNAQGENFDPSRHEAIGERDDDSTAGTVLEQLCSGCLLNGRLLRPARVIVSAKKAF